MHDVSEVNLEISRLQSELAELDSQRNELASRIIKLKESLKESSLFSDVSSILTSHSPQNEKIALFRSLFKGRQDVFPKRFESVKTGRSGYQPCCKNEWVPGLCEKPRIKCGSCSHRNFVPLSDNVVVSHLLGYDSTNTYKRDFTIGVYPLLEDETCWFLAVDFDKKSWEQDIRAFLDTCRGNKVPAALERSRSGNGGHVWIFFSEPVSASLARKLGSSLITETMESRPDIGLDSYDRLFPNQDTMPKGGFGNLIALPLQKKPREKGNSVFLDDSFEPLPDQWQYLSTLERMSCEDVELLVRNAESRGGVLGVKTVPFEEDELMPWKLPPSRKNQERIIGPLPKKLEIVLGNQIFIEKNSVPPSLLNRLMRIAAFQNPEFYKAQAMRFPTYDKPRIISCCESFPKHIALPRGCLDDVAELLERLGIIPDIRDERIQGNRIKIKFVGKLKKEQKIAAQAILKHDMGVLSASTAFGKTVVALNIIATRKENTLILVHRKQLLQQWKKRIVEFTTLPFERVGQVGSGMHNPLGKIDVAMIQSLRKKGVVDGLLGDYGHIVVDECHHISAQSFEMVLRQSKARYVTGLSATVTRKDGHHPIIFMNCGAVRYKVDDRKQAEARPFTHTVISRETDFTLSDELLNWESPSIQAMYSELIENKVRNSLIVHDVLQALEEKRNIVVLTERTKHLKILADALQEKVTELFLLKGGMGKGELQGIFEKITRAKRTNGSVILATGRFLGEGFDDPYLDTLFLTMPISWRGTLSQYAGRLHRLSVGKKEVIVYDYLDAKVMAFARMYEKRLTGYRSIGYAVDK